MVLSDLERDAVLAGLRLLQEQYTNLSPTILDILTDKGDALTLDGIDDLCDKLQVGNVVDSVNFEDLVLKLFDVGHEFVTLKKPKEAGKLTKAEENFIVQADRHRQARELFQQGHALLEQAKELMQ